MLKYYNRQGNPATFGTLDEVCANARRQLRHRQLPHSPDHQPQAVDFPKGLVYIYRSPNLYGGETAARNNTSFIVFSDKRYETKEAYDYLKGLDLSTSSMRPSAPYCWRCREGRATAKAIYNAVIHFTTFTPKGLHRG